MFIVVVPAPTPVLWWGKEVGYVSSHFTSAFSMVVITVNSQTGLPLEEQSYCPPMSLLGALFFCCTNASLECILKFTLSR